MQYDTVKFAEVQNGEEEVEVEGEEKKGEKDGKERVGKEKKEEEQERKEKVEEAREFKVNQNIRYMAQETTACDESTGGREARRRKRALTSQSLSTPS